MGCLGRDPGGTVWLALVVRPHLGQIRRIRSVVPELPMDQIKWAVFGSYSDQPVVIGKDRDLALRLYLQRPRNEGLFESVRS